MKNILIPGKRFISLTTLIRLILGAILIFSGVTKAISPAGLIDVLGSYGFLSGSLNGWLGSSLPWVEIVAGLWLVLGLAPRLVSWASLFLITGFTASNIYAVFFHGMSWNSQCGCFGETIPLSHTGSIILNVVMLSMALVLIVRYSKSPIYSIRPSFDYRSIRFAVTLMLVLMVIAMPVSLAFDKSTNVQAFLNAEDAVTARAGLSSQSSLDEQIRSSLAGGRPVFLYFYDPGCHSCQQQKPVVAGLENEYGDNITFLQLESQAEPQAMDDFGLAGVPAMVLVYNSDADGLYEYQKFLGATGAAVLEKSFEVGLGRMAAVQPGSISHPPAAQSASVLSADSLEQIWRRAWALGSYRFTADIDETLRPRPVPTMIGQTSQKASVKLEGDISLPDKAQLTLSSNGPGQQIPALRVFQNGGSTFVEVNGKLEPYHGQAIKTTPVNDYIGYLAAAENVRQLGIETDGGEQFTRYAFDIDGDRLNNYLKEQVLSTSAFGQTAAVSPVLRAMSGRGEVLVDSRGLPRKQILDLEMPGSTAWYDASSHVEVKFFDFGAVDTLPLPVFNSLDGVWTLQDTAIPEISVPASPDSRPFQLQSLRIVLPWLLWILVIFLLYIALVCFGRTHRLQRTLMVVLSLVVVAVPTLSITASEHRLNQRVQAASLPQENISYLRADQPEAVEEAVPPAVTSREQAIESSTYTGAQCGDGEFGVDTDSDGLDDRTEYCLGTNPFNEDTDMDGLSDSVETAGFEFTDSHGVATKWPGDPLRADSNMDGMLDTYEWLESAGGCAGSWDFDGDDIPNPWDPDNDNDGVPDDIDLSPFSVTDYQETVEFTSENPDAGDTYQYIDIQVQPALDHLQYGAATFDWPDDDKGNIQDLDGSTDDLRLIPLLTIQTNVAPEQTLASKYGVSIFDNEDKNSGYPFLIYAPLSAVKSGEEVYAYQTRVAYDPARQADIRWKVEMIWMVDAKLDQSAGNNVVFNHVPVQTYPEDSLRLAGLQVVKSGGYESAIFGTPATPDDDKELFNLIFGLSAGFLNSIRMEEQDPDNSVLQEINNRFDNANTPPALLWGLSRDVRIDLPAPYSHEDAAMADLTRSRTCDFLNSYYAGAENASLVFAHEYTSGSLDLDSIAEGQPLHFNLSTIPMTTERGVKLQMFGREGNTWSGLSLLETLKAIKERYADASGMLAELRQTYPDLTDQDIFTVLMLFYTNWGAEQRTMLDLDGLQLVSAVTGDQDIYSFLNHSTSLAEYLITIGNLAKPGGGLLIGQDISANWDYVRATEDNNYYTQIKTALSAEFKPLISIANVIAAGLIPWDKEVNETLSTVSLGLGRLVNTMKTVKQTYALIKNITNSTIRSWDHIKQIAKSWTKMGKGDVVMLVLSVGMTWASFALFTDFDDPVALGNAISLAVVETVVAVALTVLACNPVGAIIGAVLAIVDLIVFIATLGEFSFMSTAIEYTAKFFFRSETLTELDSGSFTGSDSEVQKYGAPVDGLVVGNRFEVSDHFVGVIKKTSNGRNSDLWDSGVYGEYLGGVATTGDASFANHNTNANYSSNHCTVNGSAGISTCRNDAGVIFEFLTARPNVALTITGDVKSKARYKNCVFWGICWRKNRYNTFPEDLTPTTIYLDVLPATVEDFLAWDLWTSSSGPVANSAPESTEQPGIWQLDSDGDGLSDGQENMIGTFPDKWDSDGDSLSDGQEFYHQDLVNGEWVGGWEINLLNNTTTRVFSDPLMKDTDYDGLTDDIERAGALSPNAYNSGPRLTLLATPLYADPHGSSGVYIEPGDNVDLTLKLFNGSGDPIVSGLDLCFSSAFTGYEGGDLSGDRTPDTQITKPAQCGNDTKGTRLAWDFSEENALLPLESVYTTLTLHSNPVLKQTSNPDVMAGLSAAGAISLPITQTLPVTIDVDSPVTAFTSGALVGGGITDYVLGGTASDQGSWVKEVELTLPEGTVTAVGTEDWAYTWTLPADGVYTLSARAADFFGHAGAKTNKQVTVDNTPPVVAVTRPAEGAVVSSDEEDMIDIALAGTAVDNLAGVSRVQISINNRPWLGVKLAGSKWTYNWALPGTESAQGQHNVRVRAFDKAGNLSQPVERTIVVDVVQPTSELTDRTFVVSVPSFQNNQEMTIAGVANDAGNTPEPARPAELVGDLNSIDDATIWFKPASVKDNDGGLNIQWLGDFNGDRLADLAVGLPGAADGAGRVSIIYGVSGGWDVPPDGEAIAGSPASFTGPSGAAIGLEMAAVGDVNGDGFDDMLIADTTNSRAHLVFGGATAPGTDLLLGDSPRAGLTTLLSLPAGYTLQEVGPAGDINGDGLDDIFITTVSDSRQTHLILGESLWLSRIDIVVQAAVEVELPGAEAFLSRAGDLNDDGLADFVMSVPGEDVYVFSGTASLTRQNRTIYTVSDSQPVSPDMQYTDTTMIALSGNSDGPADLFINKGESIYRCSGDEDGGQQCAVAVSHINELSFIAGVGNVHDIRHEGLNDLLMGSGTDALLYIGSGEKFEYAATFTGVQAAASAPYTAGADFNIDGSADLLLVPFVSSASGMDYRYFGQVPAVDQNALPSVGSFNGQSASLSFSSAASLTAEESITLYVDDDGLCDNATTCYLNIQDAVDAAVSGDIIEVRPGVYGGFTVITDNLTIRGVDPDAVFVDGGGSGNAVRISQASGAHLTDMTLRGAASAVRLENAGVGGYADAGKMITLEHMFIYDSEHALWMDRVSTAAVKHCTIAGLTDSSYIQVDEVPDPLLSPSWTELDNIANTPANSAGGKLLADSGGTLYAVEGGGSPSIWQLFPGDVTWNASLDAPWPVSSASAAAFDQEDNLWLLEHDERFDADMQYGQDGLGSSVQDIAYVSPSEIYIAGNIDRIGSTVLNPRGIARWNGQVWESLGTGGPGSIPPAEANTRDGIWTIAYIGSSTYANPWDIAVGCYGGVFLYDADTGTWKTLPGFQQHENSAPRVIALALNTAGARLYAGGIFYSDTGPAFGPGNNVAYWDFRDSTWHKIGYNHPHYNGISGEVYTILVDGQHVYLGGMIYGGVYGPSGSSSYWGALVETNNVIMFDESVWDTSGCPSGACWKTLDQGVSGYVGAFGLSSYYDAGQEHRLLVVGGNNLRPFPAGTQASLQGFDLAQPKWVDMPAAEDLDGSVSDLAASNGRLYLGGNFNWASGTGPETSNLAYLECTISGCSLGAVAGKGTNGDVYALETGVNENGEPTLYVGGDFTRAGLTASHNLAAYANADSDPAGGAYWMSRNFYRYEGQWSTRSGAPASIKEGTVLVSDLAGSLYAIAGGDNQLYRYRAETWSAPAELAAAPGMTGAGAAAVWADSSLFLLRGDQTNDFYRYDAGANTWTALASTPYSIDSGAGLAWDGESHLYAVPGGGGPYFMRYNLNGDAWQVLSDAPGNIRSGGGLARVGDELFAIRGGGLTGFWKYGLLNRHPEKLKFESTVFASPSGLSSVVWLSLDPSAPPEDFDIIVDNTNIWAGGAGTAWLPRPAGTPLTLGEAAFLAPSRGVYRLTSDTPFTAGYRRYEPDAVVSASECGGCYTSLQEAVNSGANRVIVQSGNYTGDIYLVSGVALLGAGASSTVITGSGDPAVISARGVQGASLSGFTLTGDGSRDGLAVTGGARHIEFSRSIVRNTANAVAVDGDETDLEVFNNTIVNNINGMVASGSAPVDVRNTILAFNSGAGLVYDAAAAVKLHNYNLYWANGSDINSDEVGAGELFLDPLFIDRFATDFRTLDSSPVADAGDPGDPAPPGTGTRVDIGYLEQGRASFYADDDYCAGCANDGLTWGVDAFATIQGTLDAAAGELQLLKEALAEPGFTVGVAEGTYAESISVPAYVNLVGSGADRTAITGAGEDAVAVTFNGVVQAGISGFDIGGDSTAPLERGILVTGFSNHIEISRNLVRNSRLGINFDGGSSGRALFNTLAGDGPVHLGSSGERTWVEVRNNILAGGDAGLRTADGGRIYNSYNLLWNTTNYDDGAGTGLGQTETDIVGSPDFADLELYRLSATSPAVDAADPSESVPLGGGTRADMGYYELTSAPLSLFLGDEDVSLAVANSGIADVEYGIVRVADPAQAIEDTLPTVWRKVSAENLEDVVGGTVRSWKTFYTPSEEGLYRIYSRAYDLVNNVETDPAVWYSGSFLVDGTAPAVNWLSPSGTVNAPVDLRAEVTDYIDSSFNVEQIYFEVNGSRVEAEWTPVSWNTTLEEARVFRAWVPLEADSTVQAFAVDGAGNTGQSLPVSLIISGQNPPDEAPPELSVTSPLPGAVLRGTVELSGTAFDSQSGLAGVELSLDGGITWLGAGLAGGDTWLFSWETPDDQEFVTYPLRIRAGDNAGNMAELTLDLTVDNQPPGGLVPVDFSVAPGRHLSVGDALVVSWQDPVDGSGQAETLVAVDTAAETFPEAVQSGNTLTWTFEAPGQWYVHIAAQDPTGNKIVYHGGPWYVGDGLNAICSNRQRSTILDGVVDVTNGEWSDLSQRLGDDERPAKQQVFYAAWDAANFYLAWTGAHWQIDGTLWAYLGDAAGGTTRIVSGADKLPFEAGYAVEVLSPTSGKLWQYDGDHWVSMGALDFAQSEGGETEVRLPLGTAGLTGPVSLLAYAASEKAVWSIFPTTDPLKGSWNEYYHWDDLCAAAALPNEGQPQYISVNMAVTSPQQGAVPWGPGASLTYTVDITNHEYATLSGMRLTAGSSVGLTFQSQIGAESCLSCVPGTAGWEMELPDLPSGQSGSLTLIGKLGTADDLAGFDKVTTLIDLKLGDVQAAQGSYSHRIDATPPVVEVFYKKSLAISTGKGIIYGRADDGAGSGIARVEWSPAGSSAWSVTSGAGLWSFEVDVTDPGIGETFDIELRGIDYCGNVSAPLPASFEIDRTPPTLQIKTSGLPSVVTGNFLNISGTANDISSVTRVEIRVDNGSWLTVPGLYSPSAITGNQNWLFTWDIPAEDSSVHHIEARAADVVGNVSVPVSIDLRVDTACPAVNGKLDIDEVVLWDYVGLPGMTGPPVLSGSISDDSGLKKMWVNVITPDGIDLGAQSADPDASGYWTFTPLLSRIKGTYTLAIGAVDLLGNKIKENLRPRFSLAIANTPPVADAGGPYSTKEGTAVELSAAGSMDPDYLKEEEISLYEWDIDGDGEYDDAAGETIQALFDDNGDYTPALRVTDIGRASDTDIATVTVENVAPTVNAGPDKTISYGASFSGSGSFSDPGADVWTATVDYGDGPGVSPLALNPNKTFSLSHTYAATGTHTVIVTVTDDDGGSGTDTVVVTKRSRRQSSGGDGTLLNSLAIDLNGTQVSASISADGIVQQTISSTSPDRRISFTIPAGTAVQTEKGEPLSSLSMALSQKPPLPPRESGSIGPVYDFGPGGATFDPPATLVWRYNPAELPTGVNEAGLFVAFYDNLTGSWTTLPGVVDTVNHQITVSLGHFTTFALLAPLPVAVPSPVPSPVAEVTPTFTPAPSAVPAPVSPRTLTPSPAPSIPPAPEEEKGTGLWVIIGPIIGVLLIGIIVYLIVKRRRSSSRE